MEYETIALAALVTSALTKVPALDGRLMDSFADCVGVCEGEVEGWKLKRATRDSWAQIIS